jgi:Family of unknown function (DUF6406)
MDVGAQIHVGKGTVRHRKGLSFGGSAMAPARDGEPAHAIISMWENESGERDFKLTVGESFEFAGQTWRLDGINDKSHRLSATLTRVA